MLEREQVSCRRASACGESVQVELCVLDDMGHQWPPYDVALVSDPGSSALQGSDYVLEFLLRQRRR